MRLSAKELLILPLIHPIVYGPFWRLVLIPDCYKNGFLFRLSSACALLASLALLIFSTLRPASAQQAVPTSAVSRPGVPNVQSVEIKGLEVSEQLSESLANQLLDLSVAVRELNREQTAHFFADSITAPPFPSQPGPMKPDIKWISTHQWIIPDASAPPASVISRQQFLDAFFLFLSHFSFIEDVRFKLKLASFDDSAKADLASEVPTAIPAATGHGRIFFYIVGRDLQQKREWARGTMEADVRYNEHEQWQITGFKLSSFDSMVADTDLFSEVSIPAGLSITKPAFGTSGNDGFTYRGAVAADFNNDGWMDLFVCGSEHNFLYLNDGKGHFRDVSSEVGLDAVEPCTGAVAFDYDNDGDEDLFLSSIGPQMLLKNLLKEKGKLQFEDFSQKAGVARTAIGFSVAVGDVNGDGLPDVYVTSYNLYGKVVPDSWFKATNGTRNLLFINQGDGTFKEESTKWGVDDPRWSYAAEFADVNGDGKLDLYVVNDFGEKALYINKGDHFEDEAEARGVLDPGNGMGVSFGDFNNDGLLDLHVTNMSSTAGNRILSRLFPNSSPKDNVLKKLAAGNSLYQNMGDGHYKDVTAEVGGLSGGWAWGGGFIDFDNDGWEDLYSPNGFISGKSMKDT